MQGCGKNENGESNSAAKIELSDTSVTADTETGKISVTITIKNFGRLDGLEITKIDGASVSSEMIVKSRLSNRYVYEYTVTESDSNPFLIEFLAVSVDGTLSEVKTLQVFKPAGQVALSIDKTTVVPDTSTGKLSAKLTIGSFSQLDYLFVEQTDWEETSSRKIPAAELSAEYIFAYTADESDSDLFTFRFTAVDKAGQVSESKTLTVDRRKKLGFTNLRAVSRVTGAEDNRAPMPDVEYAVNNQTDQLYNVGGTDLGIVWEMEPGHYGLFFGDTFGADFSPNFSNPGPNGGSWRSNVLLFSDDTDLSDGMTISGAATDSGGAAREIVKSDKNTSGLGEYTTIPTAAIRANGADYVHYMSIRNWNGWVTNHSAYYKSEDNGKTWALSRNISFGSWSNFGQAGFYKKDGYVYMVSTITGRYSKPHLARFREKDIERKSEYEFWDALNQQWVKGNEDAATILIDDTAGELSIAYHQKYGKWILLYFNGDRYDITFREANEITGPWSAPKKLADGWVYPQLYGSYIHPLSVKGDKLYFIMSMWLPYNSYLMCADLVRE